LIKVVSLLLALVLRYPDAAFMTRSNHEMNDRDGFRRDLAEAFHSDSTTLFQVVNSCFDWLTVSALLGAASFVSTGDQSIGSF
jgi:hypothetical protein